MAPKYTQFKFLIYKNILIFAPNTPWCTFNLFAKQYKLLKYRYKPMKKNIKFLAAALIGLAAVACSSPEKMAKMADNVIVTCNPGVLEVVGGQIEASFSVT